MVRRKLAALGYNNSSTFDVNDEKQFRNVVLWLEDQKIRHYKIEDRAGLRSIGSNTWQKAFDKYMSDVNCPMVSAEPAEQLEWLIGLAVRLEYSDMANEDAAKFADMTSQKAKDKKSSAPVVKSSNPLDALDFDSAEFRAGLLSLCEMLKIAPHPDNRITAAAVASVVFNNITNPPPTEGTVFPVLDMELGFNLGDHILNKAAKVLRLLYIQDLRSLQTAINEAIVAVQTTTADPKTDTRLGKVGF